MRALLLALLLPACSLDLADPSSRLDGMACGRVPGGAVPPQADGCYHRAGNPTCRIVLAGDPCGDELELYYSGVDYEVWCDALGPEGGPSFVAVPCP